MVPKDIELRMKRLQPFPTVWFELLSLMSESEVGIDQVTALIARDPTLTARLLRYANSAALTRLEPAVSVHDAVRRIGIDGSFRFLSTELSASTLTMGDDGYAQTGRQLWIDGVIGARAAHEIALQVDLQPSVVYTAALVRDIGKLVLSENVGQNRVELLSRAEELQDFTAAERTHFNAAHPSIGAELADRWRFPEQLVEAIRWHHHPSGAVKNPKLVAAVHLADLVATMVGAGGIDGMLLPFDERAYATLGVSDDIMVDLVISAGEWVREIAELAD
jgi:HD-like signal output (HDOD) protein